MRYLSPLRYPGGKGGLAPFLASVVQQQNPRPLAYMEPFAGGAGAALRLLIEEEVDRIILNDFDKGIAAFWRAVFNDTDAFVKRIRQCSVSIRQWHIQREIYRSGDTDDLALGFATFFLNRTNRSGIMDAKPIGGFDQTGAWKIDARFNKEALIERVEAIAPYRNRITLLERDALELLDEFDSKAENCLIYVDPPYLEKGGKLYMDNLSWDDHVALAELLPEKHKTWLLTYDADKRVSDTLYPNQRCASFDIAHTAAKQHVGSEYVVFSDDLSIASLDGLSRTTSWVRKASA